MRYFRPSYDSYALASPPEEPLRSGTIIRELLEGPQEGEEVEIEFGTENELTIFSAVRLRDNAELSPSDIHRRDRDAIRETAFSEQWQND